MQRYRTRPGVLLCEVCGEYLLVAAREVLKSCPYVTQVNETSAFLWRRMVPGATLEELGKAVRAEYEIDDINKTDTAIRDFIHQMLELGYLLEEGDPNET